MSKPVVEIVSTLPAYIPMLKDSLRDKDRAEIMNLGITPSRALWRSFRRSIMCKTVFVDGEIAAIFGISGEILGEIGRPWLLTSPAAEKVSPLRFVRIYQKEVEEMLKLFPYLASVVDASYDGAVRLLENVGFTVHEPQPLGPDNAAFRKFEMRHGN